MEKYTEIKIYPSRDWGISVEDFRADIGEEGITITTYDIDRDGSKASKLSVCMTFEEALLVSDAIKELIP